jgi:hypothetical protein
MLQSPHRRICRDSSRTSEWSPHRRLSGKVSIALGRDETQFVHVRAVRPEATSDLLSDLISDSFDYAKKTKGRLRGLQTGVAVIPIVASDTVAPDAIELVRSRPVKGFAAMAMPAIVDLSTGESHLYEGNLSLGLSTRSGFVNV